MTDSDPIGVATLMTSTRSATIAAMINDSEKPTVELLRKLTLAAGPPGAEDSVRALVREALDGVQGIEIDRDRLGSVIATRQGSSERPRVLLDAHLDEVGFMVQSIDSEGNLGFVPLGGWWAHVLLAQRVDVITERGPVPGVIGAKPPHFLSPEERQHVMKIESMHIDVGATSDDEARGFGVEVGDPIVPHAEFIHMANPRVLSSKAFDDRAGVGLLVETLQRLPEIEHPNTVIGVGAVQEEVGCRGAGTAAAMAKPDVGIILEGTPADDQPGFPSATRQACLGEGPQIRFADPSAISNRALVRLVRDVAVMEKIPIQLAVRRSGGTDAKSVHVHDRGVPTVVIGVPARSIHTNVSLIHLDDFLAARKLILALIARLDERTVESLCA